MESLKSILTNVLTALYQPFWFAVSLTFFVSLAYLYCADPVGAGEGWRAVLRGWVGRLHGSSFFRKLTAFAFYTVMILFRTLFNRSLIANPLSNVMGDWWIWTVAPDGTKAITTSCIENILMMMPFTFMLFWTYGERAVPSMRAGAVVWGSGKTAFLFSLAIETLQLLLYLGTWQLSDLAYNTLGGEIGGAVYCVARAVADRGGKVTAVNSGTETKDVARND